MKIIFNGFKFTIKINEDKSYSDLLAYVSMTLKDEHQRNFICNGFTIRKSKNNGEPYLTFPSKKTGTGFYKFNLIEKSLFKEIEKEVLRQYSEDIIPIIIE